MSDTIPETVDATVPPDADPDEITDADVAGVIEEATPAKDAPTEETPAADEPAAETPETEDEPADDAEVANEPADVASAQTVAQTVAQPAPDPTAQAQQQATVQAQKAYQDRVAKFQTDLAAHDALVNSPGYDAYEHAKESARLNIESIKLQQIEMQHIRASTEEAQSIAKEQAFWSDWSRQHPDVGARGRAIFEEEVTKASKKYGDLNAVNAVATENFERRVDLIKRQKAAKTGTAPRPAVASIPGAKPPAPKPAVTPKPTGGRITPTGGAARPAAAERDPEDEFAAAVGSHIKDFLP